VKYLDTTYIVLLYFQDEGWERVRALAASDDLACSLIGRAESVAAFHRKLREGTLNKGLFEATIQEFHQDCKENAFHWLPFSEKVIARLIAAYNSLPASTNLRAADAIHLASASENAFSEIYSNDSRLLNAAPFFGVKGVNVI
jgi:predicted nucleic acid-binding protein